MGVGVAGTRGVGFQISIRRRSADGLLFIRVTMTTGRSGSMARRKSLFPVVIAVTVGRDPRTS
jgi:hypothetical protein